MSVRVILIAVAVAVSAAGAAAQPGKNQPQPKAASAKPAPVVLASAGDVRRPSATDDGAVESAHRPAPRVTTCRCGDPQASEDPAAREQPDR
jgi:hypothetical protein